MGERAGYRVSRSGKSLLMIRKQWYEGSTHAELSTFTKNVASQLLVDRLTIRKTVPTIGDGCVALRNDLGVGRLSMALITSLSEPPFDEVVEGDDIHCDINDHGIFEIELIEWNVWNLNHYPVEYSNKTDVLGEKKHLATIKFQEKKSLIDGMTIEFCVPNDWEYSEEKE